MLSDQEKAIAQAIVDGLSLRQIEASGIASRRKIRTLIRGKKPAWLVYVNALRSGLVLPPSDAVEEAKAALETKLRNETADLLRGGNVKPGAVTGTAKALRALQEAEPDEEEDGAEPLAEDRPADLIACIWIDLAAGRAHPALERLFLTAAMEDDLRPAFGEEGLGILRQIAAKAGRGPCENVGDSLPSLGAFSPEEAREAVQGYFARRGQ
ncbi:MAG TPA: hypothetical protein VKM54_24485 [Myxococcota bacterium]|nr:hypothetical protein [Myxococcota bacterium]